MPPFPTCWQSVFRNFLTTVPCLPVRDYIKQVETIKAQEELARKAALPGMANKMKDANLRLMHRHTTDKGCAALAERLWERNAQLRCIVPTRESSVEPAVLRENGQ